MDSARLALFALVSLSLGPCLLLWFAAPAHGQASTQPASAGLTLGATAPEFTRPDQNGQDVSLSGLRGKWVVLYFYPKADTPGCTTEACDLSDGIEKFTNLRAVVLGMSPDPVAAQKKFADKYQLKITLLADPDRQVMRAYRGVQEVDAGGKTTSKVVRSTLIIDPQGRIAFHWPSVSPKGHADMVRQKLEELQKAAG